MDAIPQHRNLWFAAKLVLGGLTVLLAIWVAAAEVTCFRHWAAEAPPLDSVSLLTRVTNSLDHVVLFALLAAACVATAATFQEAGSKRNGMFVAALGLLAFATAGVVGNYAAFECPSASSRAAR